MRSARAQPSWQFQLVNLAIARLKPVSADALQQFHQQAQIVNRYVVAELLQSDAIVGLIRKEMRRLFDNLKVADEQLRTILTTDVIKRDALDGDSAITARSTIKKATTALARKAAPKPE